MPEPAAKEFVLAVDLGGTRFRVALVKEGGLITARASYPTEADQGPARIIERIADAVRQLQASLQPGEFVRGLGVAAPGPLDPWEGVVLTAPNLPGWHDVPLKDMLERSLQVHTVIGNDANLAALGEWRYGAGRGHRDLVYLTVSTGVGSGVIANGQLLLGHQGLATEAGHTTIDLHGPVCRCGNRGCLEMFASGTAIARQAAERLQAGRASSLSASRERLTAETIAAAAQLGDALASELLLDAARALGVGVVNLIHLFNPTIVILGGGVTLSGDLWWDAVRGTVDRFTMADFRRHVRVVAAELEDDAGLLGAAVAVWEESTLGRAP